MTELHRGRSCRHLLRSKHGQTDCRCRKAIERYGTPQYAFLDTISWVPVDVAAEALDLSAAEVMRRVQEGKFPKRYAPGVSMRVVVEGRDGPKELTLGAAAKRLRVSREALQRRIESGDVKAHYKDEHLQVQITTRRDYEKCPLWEHAGICMDYEAKESKG